MEKNPKGELIKGECSVCGKSIITGARNVEDCDFIEGSKNIKNDEYHCRECGRENSQKIENKYRSSRLNKAFKAIRTVYKCPICDHWDRDFETEFKSKSEVRIHITQAHNNYDIEERLKLEKTGIRYSI